MPACVDHGVAGSCGTCLLLAALAAAREALGEFLEVSPPNPLRTSTGA